MEQLALSFIITMANSAPFQGLGEIPFSLASEGGKAVAAIDASANCSDGGGLKSVAVVHRVSHKCHARRRWRIDNGFPKANNDMTITPRDGISIGDGGSEAGQWFNRYHHRNQIYRIQSTSDPQKNPGQPTEFLILGNNE